jgi:hypothetical protein
MSYGQCARRASAEVKQRWSVIGPTNPHKAWSVMIGRDLSLPTVVTSMLENEESWDAMNSCVNAMTYKEAAERAKEVDPRATPFRRRRPGRRRRQYARLLPSVGSQSSPCLGGSDRALHVVVDAPDAPGRRLAAPLVGAGAALPRQTVTAGAMEVSVRVLMASSSP